MKLSELSELSNHLIYPSKYLKSNHLNKNINMKFKQFLSFNFVFCLLSCALCLVSCVQKSPLFGVNSISTGNHTKNG